MLSYKKINLLDLRLENSTIKNKNTELEIKTPIITFTLENSLLYLNINRNSEQHTMLLNICEYIDRLFKISNINSNFLHQEKITLNVTNTSKIYDENSKIINIKNIKKDGKIICSFICHSGQFYLKNLLFIK